MDADPAGNKIIFDLCILLFFTLMNAFFRRSRDGSCFRESQPNPQSCRRGQ